MQEEIGALKEGLVVERKKRHNKEVYEEACKDINKYPPHLATKASKHSTVLCGRPSFLHVADVAAEDAFNVSSAPLCSLFVSTEGQSLSLSRVSEVVTDACAWGTRAPLKLRQALETETCPPTMGSDVT